MKAVMYHYVRSAPAGLSYFRYLHVDNFRRQLDWLAARHRFVSREEFLSSVNTARAVDGVLLTFDDAFSDHHEHVLPELAARGLWGIFYVPTMILQPGRLLDVHRVHWILGRLGGLRAMELAKELVSDDMLSHAHVEDFRRLTYVLQDNDAATNLFKRTMNYFISYEHREPILDRLMVRVLDGTDESDLKSRFYLSRDQIKAMHRAGMTIGSHTVSHPVMSKLDDGEQEREIRRSFDDLEEIVGEKTRTFCYPYGGFHTFTATTERLLADRGALFSFNVEARDISDDDLSHRPQALPRYDCNNFPYGAAHMGSESPVEAVRT
jgi:peptidoglycan/xylan/chitin deacetylase (PgdA/CDA1 family)